MQTSMKRYLKWLVAALIIVSFLLTGVGRELFGGGFDAQTVAKIGTQKITIQEFIQEYKNQSYDIQNRFNFNLTEDQLKSLGLGGMVFNYLVQQKVMKELFKKIKFNAQDISAAKLIRAEKYFLTDGKFDRQKFESFLQNTGLTEDQYIKRTAFMLCIGAFYSMFYNTGFEYESLSNTLYQSEYESRLVGVSKVKKTFEEDKKSEIKDDKILEFYKNNQALFQTKEYRSGQYFVIDEKSINTDLINIEKIQLDQSFKLNDLDKVFDLQYIKFDSFEEAKSATKNPEKISLDKKIEELKGITKPELLSWIGGNQDFKEGNWTLAFHEGQHYIAKVVSINELSDQVIKEKLKSELKQKMQHEKLTEIVELMEDEILKGAKFDDLLKKYGGFCKKFDFVSLDSKHKDGSNSFLSPQEAYIAFQLKKNKPSEFFYTNKSSDQQDKDSTQNDAAILHSYMSILVENIQPSIQKPIQEVKSEIEHTLQSDYQNNQLKKIAEQKAQSSQFDTEIKVYRQNINKEKNPEQDLPDGFLDSIFELKKEGEVTRAFAHSGHFIAAKLLKIEKPEKNKIIITTIKNQIKNQIAQSLIAELTHYYQREFGLKINQELLKDYM